MKIYISQFDFERLNNLLAKKTPHDDYDKALIEELTKAEVIEPASIPDDVITMNSQVKFVDENDEMLEYWLVFPEDADLSQNKLSVLSPVGSSIIGYKVGSKVKIPTPKGQRELTVKDITFQPERAGDFNS